VSELRGKRCDNGNWAKGSLLCWKDGARHICEKDSDSTHLTRHSVRNRTVGQYTGLKDKNGNKIFAGDVVRFGDDIYQIVFADACFWISDPNNHYSMELHIPIGMGLDDILGRCGLEVIGNIHDDPDLLKANDG